MNPINDKVENGKMLETIFNNTHFLVAYIDNDFNFIQVNRAYAEKHNKEPDFFVGKNHFELYPKGNESIFKEVIETGEPYFTYSKPLEHPILGMSYWDWAIQPVKDENGEVDGVILSLTDVTDFKRNENEILKEQNEFIDELVENRVSEILSEKEDASLEFESKENELVELNEKIEQLEKDNKILQEKLDNQEISDKEDFQIESFDKQISQLRKANENFKKIISAQNPEIEELYTEVVELKKIQDNSEDILSGKLSEINDLNQRITELENDASEKEEIISKRELEIEELSQEIIELEKTDVKSSEVITDKDSEIEKLNQEISKIKQNSASSSDIISTKDSEIEKLNQKITELEKNSVEDSEIIEEKETTIEEINKNLKSLQDALEESNEIISKKEIEARDLNQEILDLQTLKDDSAEIISAEMHEIQELNEKINEKQRNINELTKRNEKLKSELENSTNDEELLIQLDELIKANEELEKFAETAANELQEPLRAVKSFNNILAKRYRGKLDKDADEFIDYAIEAVERLNNKIIGLLEYSRVESRGKEFKLTETQELLDYAISNLNASIDENNAKITYDDLPKVMADSGQILQLFQNLLKNSVKFKNPEENPIIHVSAYLDDDSDEYVFSVEDNGIGIEEKDLEKIFDIFKRLHPENGHRGIGIGLSIGKRIVERHGGRIWVESEPEIGSKFYFTIPSVE
ncbi:MAG TPA: ATP-binding protein [Methanobacterium sp.]|nr:ATP-binding protein [Methanobacterium sp.]